MKKYRMDITTEHHALSGWRGEEVVTPREDASGEWVKASAIDAVLGELLDAARQVEDEADREPDSVRAGLLRVQVKATRKCVELLQR